MYRTIQKPVLFLTFFLALFFRFHALDRQSLWDDEMSTVRTVTLPSSELKSRFEAYEVHPPLYFMQLRLWMKLAGKSLVSIRANSALWGTLGLILMYWLARDNFGPWAGWLAMALMGISPLHLAYSQEARPYALAMALGTAALLVLEKSLNQFPELDSRALSVSFDFKRDRRWIVLGGFWTLLLYTHYWGSFVVAAQALYGFWKAPSTRVRRLVLAAFFGACLLFCFWLPILIAQIHIIGGLAFWMPLFSIGQLFKPIVAFTGLYFNVASFVFYVPTRVGLLVAVGFIMVTAAVTGLFRGPRGAGVWLVAGLMVPWVLSYWSHSMYLWYRYPTLMYPAFVLLVVAGFRAWKPVWLRAALVGVCLFFELWGCWFYFTGWQKANPKSVVQYIHGLHEPDAIVIRPSYFGTLFNFYDGGSLQTLDQNLLDSAEKRAALRGRHIILIAFQVPSDPVSDALLTEFHPVTARRFAGFAHLGITVYQLQ